MGTYFFCPGTLPEAFFFGGKRVFSVGTLPQAPFSVKRHIFGPGTCTPVTDRFVRRVGRPKKEWTKELLRDCISIFGSTENACIANANREEWNRCLRLQFGF